MKNEYQLLKQENALRAAYLTAENLAQIKELERYLKRYERNSYDVALVKKEMIGMALTAQQNRQTLTQSTGGGTQAFYEQVCGNVRKRSFINWVVTDVFFCVVFMFCILCFALVLNQFDWFSSVHHNWAQTFVLLALLYAFSCIMAALPRPAVLGKWKSALLRALPFLFFFGVLLCIGTFTGRLTFYSLPMLEFPLLWVLLLHMALMIALYWGRIAWYNYCAQQTPWRD